VRSSSFWEWKEDLLSISSILVSWCLGFIVLHFWAFLCYVGVFESDFWMRNGFIGVIVPIINDNGFQDEDNNDNDENDSYYNEENSEGIVERRDSLQKWQGKDGIIFRVVQLLYSILYNQEWDKVDHVMLIEEFSLPVIRQLFVVFCLPLLIFMVAESLFSGLLQSKEDFIICK